MSVPTNSAPDPYALPSTEALIDAALAEDLNGQDDVTVASLVPKDAQLLARMTAKQEGVICGVPLFAQVCQRIAADSVKTKAQVTDGDQVAPGNLILEATGDARTILIAERTALNIMQRLSGVASQAHSYAAAVAGTQAQVLDTRKTTPGMRSLEKHAVLMGGCANHRIGLFDQVLIKENHIALMEQTGASGLPSPGEAVARSRTRCGPDTIIQVEIEDLTDLPGVIEAGANIVLLDNMGPELLSKAVHIRGDSTCLLEASGGITLETIRSVAESGIDRISIGALTHSVPALDLSLRCEAV